eukprot:8866490-Lingulodinium_polyedra.AAC.1
MPELSSTRAQTRESRGRRNGGAKRIPKRAGATGASPMGTARKPAGRLPGHWFGTGLRGARPA